MQYIPSSNVLRTIEIPLAKTKFEGLKRETFPSVPHFSRLYANSLHVFHGLKYPLSAPNPPFASSKYAHTGRKSAAQLNAKQMKLIVVIIAMKNEDVAILPAFYSQLMSRQLN
jgi:hypothetical protein